jgi:HEAT repeat protein
MKASRSISEILRSGSSDEVVRGVQRLRPRLRQLGGADFRDAVEALCGLLYIDTYDRPDLEPAVAAAVAALGHAGRRAIPVILSQIESTDVKCHMHLAQALGLMGAEAVAPLRRVLATAADAYAQAFALYALGKVRNPSVARALPEVLSAAHSSDKEVRDSAVRTLGKIAQAARPSQVSAPRRLAMYEALMRALDDPQAPVRAKAIRSLGKMAAEGHLKADQIETVLRRAMGLLGQDDEFNWDRAYIVRHEAAEALRCAEERLAVRPSR